MESGDPDETASTTHEDAPMEDTRGSLGIAATLCRMALVRRHTLSVNGAYVQTPAQDRA